MNVPEGLGGPPPPVESLDSAVRVTLAGEGVEQAEVSLTLLGDEDIAELHERYLGVAGPTDVLSFALHGKGEPPLGDVYIGYEAAGRSAAQLGLSHAEELVRLAVHGVLHVLGHDHPLSRQGASPMYRRQEELVRQVLDQEAGG